MPVFKFPHSPCLDSKQAAKTVQTKINFRKFFLCEDGWFTVDPSQSFNHFRQRAYLFIAENSNPIPITILQKLKTISEKTKYDEFLAEVARLKKIHENDGEEEGYTKEELEHIYNLNPVNNLDPAELQILKNYSEVDPQTLSTGLNAVVNIDKLFKRRSKTIGTTIPMGLIVIAIIGVIGVIMFGDTIFGMLSDGLVSMGLLAPPVEPEIIQQTVDAVNNATQEAINTATGAQVEIVKDPEIIENIESRLNEDVPHEDEVQITIEPEPTEDDAVDDVTEPPFVNPSLEN